MSEPAPKREFKGVWIPKEIWEDTAITWMEKCLLAEINCLDGDDSCTASNEYLAVMFKTTAASIANQISRLRKLEYIETVSFDGRKRKLQVNPALTLMLRQKKAGNESSLNPSVKAVYRENKEERKVENPKAPEASAPPSLFPEMSSSIKSKMENSPVPKTPTDERALAIAKLYGRRPSTEWSPKEIKAYKALKNLSLEDLKIIEDYYSFERAKKKNYLRRDLLTFLNNYNGELDRANAWNGKPKAQEKQDKPIF